MAAAPLLAIVDDDDSARIAVSGLVRAMGFAIVAFASAAEFLGSDLRAGVACLIADVRMPGMGGLALLRHLAATGRPIATILVTAYPEEATQDQALAAGARCCLVKPFEPEALLLCIRMALTDLPPVPDP